MRGDPDCIHTSLVEGLVASGALLSESVERAFRRVRRHRFLEHWYRLEATRLQAVWRRVEFDREDPDEESLAKIYSDCSLVTRVNGYLPTASSSQPSLVSRMLELLGIAPGMRVLEIGTGTGYNAALLAEVIGDPAAVYTIEFQQDVANKARDVLAQEGYGGVHVLTADAVLGFPEGAPFARIEATVGCSDLSPHWLDQLAPNGLMIIPLQHGHLHPLVQVVAGDKHPTRPIGRAVGHSAFMPIQGSMTWANPWQSYLIGGLPSGPAWQRELPISLPTSEGAADPLDDETHRAFYFYLTLSSRELWRTNEGYGLADPEGRATAVVTNDGLAVHHREGGKTCAEHLCDRLEDLLHCWERLGRPTPEAYEMEFVPKKEIPSLGAEPGREWVVERIHFWQVIRLP